VTISKKYHGAGSERQGGAIALNSRTRWSQRVAETGIQAQPSYAYLPRPDATPIDMTNMKWVVQQQQKFDAILVSRLTKRDSTTTYVPGQVFNTVAFLWHVYGYYGALYPAIYSPGYLGDRERSPGRNESLFHGKT